MADTWKIGNPGCGCCNPGHICLEALNCLNDFVDGGDPAGPPHESGHFDFSATGPGGFSDSASAVHRWCFVPPSTGDYTLTASASRRISEVRTITWTGGDVTVYFGDSHEHLTPQTGYVCACCWEPVPTVLPLADRFGSHSLIYNDVCPAGSGVSNPCCNDAAGGGGWFTQFLAPAEEIFATWTDCFLALGTSGLQPFPICSNPGPVLVTYWLTCGYNADLGDYYWTLKKCVSYLICYTQDGYTGQAVVSSVQLGYSPGPSPANCGGFFPNPKASGYVSQAQPATTAGVCSPINATFVFDDAWSVTLNINGVNHVFTGGGMGDTVTVVE